MKYIVCSVITVFILSTACKAQGWKPAGSTETRTFYLNTSYLYKNNGLLTFWAKSVADSVLQDKPIGTASDYILEKNVYNPKSRQSKLLAHYTYEHGRLVDSRILQSKEQEWSEIIPGSLWETVTDKIRFMANKTKASKHKATTHLTSSHFM